MAATSQPPQLCVCDDATFWPWRTWPELAHLAKTEALVVVPIAGCAERGDLPLDLEEGLLMRVLRSAAENFEHAGRLLVVPPLRFVVGPAGVGVFTVEPPVAHACIAEVCRSIAASGFRRIVLCNASPWNEELCEVAARDLRIDCGLQMFCVHLSALGFDLRAPDAATSGELARLIADAAPAALDARGRHLAALWREILARPPLRDDGRLGPVTPHVP